MIEANRAKNAEQKLKGRWWALLALAFCLLVISLDMTVLNVALPTLAKDLQATESQLQWMVDAYTLVYASLVLLGGSLGDRFGRKRMLLLGLLLFGAGSLWSAFSGNATLLVLARGFMGIGGALFWSPNTSTTMGAAPRNRLGVASATLNTMRNVGMVCSYAVALAVAAVSMPPDLVNAVFLGTVGHLPLAISEAFTSAIARAFIASAVICLIALAFSLTRVSSYVTAAEVASSPEKS